MAVIMYTASGDDELRERVEHSGGVEDETGDRCETE
jgi:hypothetical protein